MPLRERSEMENNQRFAELVGICWHEQKSWDLLECGKCGHEMLFTLNPDFTDAREVLRVMSREQQLFFLRSLAICPAYYIKIDYILDTTGKLRDLAIKWMEEQK